MRDPGKVRWTHLMGRAELVLEDGGLLQVFEVNGSRLPRWLYLDKSRNVVASGEAVDWDLAKASAEVAAKLA